MSTNFISNVGYFKRYSHRIYGLTGTLGSKETQELLKHAYPIDLVFMPTYKQKHFVEFPAVVAETPELWGQELIRTIQEEVDKNRAVLVICETINVVEQLEQALSRAGHSLENIKRYSRNDNDEQLVISNVIGSKQIIIATNLAGRGTDIKTTPELEQYGGLHVCLSFLPNNSRVEAQAFGRSARQGKQGSGQLVIMPPVAATLLYKQFPHLGKANNIRDLKAWRDERESIRLEKVRSYSLPEITLKDDLFEKFCTFAEILRGTDANKYKLAEVEDRWGFWLKAMTNKINKDYPPIHD